MDREKHPHLGQQPSLFSDSGPTNRVGPPSPLCTVQIVFLECSPSDPWVANFFILITFEHMLPLPKVFTGQTSRML